MRATHGHIAPLDGVGRSHGRRLRSAVAADRKDGQRDDLLRVLGNYLRTLETGEPGTTLISVAADPNDEKLVWVWEEFADAEAVQAHFEHDFFRALQLELADLLAEPVAVRPLAPDRPARRRRRQRRVVTFLALAGAECQT